MRYHGHMNDDALFILETYDVAGVPEYYGPMLDQNGYVTSVALNAWPFATKEIAEHSAIYLNGTEGRQFNVVRRRTTAPPILERRMVTKDQPTGSRPWILGIGSKLLILGEYMALSYAAGDLEHLEDRISKGAAIYTLEEWNEL